MGGEKRETFIGMTAGAEEKWIPPAVLKGLDGYGILIPLLCISRIRQGGQGKRNGQAEETRQLARRLLLGRLLKIHGEKERNEE